MKIRRLAGALASALHPPATRPRLRAAAVAAACAAASVGLAMAPAAHASAATVNTPMPAHVFAPYWQSYSGDDPLTISQESGAKYISAAFLQTATTGSCTAYWDGEASQPIAQSQWGSDFTAIQNNGGNVIPSFGGYNADANGYDIADSCTNVNDIAAAYESVITTYNVSRIDLDVESNSLQNSNNVINTAGITRRNEAVAQVEAWAAQNNRTIQFSYTLPIATNGLTLAGLYVLQNAVTEGAVVSVVNAMTFDYYQGSWQEMANDTETAATDLESQMQGVYPNDSASQLWSMIGITEMPGIDDYGPDETFTEDDGTTVLNWAKQQGINTLSFWSLERDNGGCPGSKELTCSGISQTPWYFSNLFEPFTSGGSSTPPPTSGFSVAASPASASVAAGSSATSTVSTAVTSGSAQSVALTASGAPSGVTVSFSPSSVTAGGSSTATFATSSSTAAGTYPIAITGTGSSGTESATYTLTVTAGGSGGGSGGSGSLVNGNFETGSLSPWTCQSGDSVQSTTVHSGEYALEEVPTSSQTGECDQAVTLAPNTTYTLSGWVQGNYATIGVEGDASNHTWSSDSSWNQLSINFTTGSTGAVTVYIDGWYGFGNIYADDVTLTAA